MQYGALVGADAKPLAASVRRLRSANGWTLDHAAARLGISRRLLAQIEAGGANPSLSTLLGIADGFSVHLVDLLGTSGPTSSMTVQEDPAAGPALWSSSGGGVARLLVGRGPLELWHWVLAPGDVHDSRPHSTASVEALHLLDGVVAIDVGTETVQLDAGASVLFDADGPHAYRNPTAQAASFLLTVFDPAAR